MGEVLFTYHRMGNMTKVTAIDTKTSKEVSIISPSNLSQNEMQIMALNKLAYVLKKGTEKN
jgi:hypothetical protein